MKGYPFRFALDEDMNWWAEERDNLNEKGYSRVGWTCGRSPEESKDKLTKVLLARRTLPIYWNGVSDVTEP